MLVQKNGNFRYIILAAAVSLCAVLFTVCENPSGGDDSDADKGKATNTYVQFVNRERFPVTLYSDASRQTQIIRAEASGVSVTVAAAPSPSGKSYYPVFHLELFDLPGISVPYNGPSVVSVVQEGQVNQVIIPALESIETGSAYLKLKNESDFSLVLALGNSEKTPLGGGASIIQPGRTVAYVLDPSPASIYSLLRNTTTPLPLGLFEFNADTIYTFKYDGRNLSLEDSSPVQASLLAAPQNVRLETLSSSSVKVTWDAVPGAAYYKIYYTSDSSFTNSAIFTSITPPYTHTGIPTGTKYYYRVSAVNNKSQEGPYSAAVFPVSSMFTVTYLANGATGTAPTARTVDAGTVITVASQGSLSYSGRIFAGWNTEKSGQGTVYAAGGALTVNNGYALYAQWISNTSTSYTLTYYANGANGAVPTVQTAKAGTAAAIAAQGSLSYAGKTFKGWNTNTNGSGKSYAAGESVKLTGNISLYAQWAAGDSDGIGGADGTDDTLVPGETLADKLSWLRTNAASNGTYLVEVAADEYFGPQTLSYSGKNNVNITLYGTGAPITVGLTSNGSLFTVTNGVNLTLDNNITLKGKNSNTASVVKVNIGGSVVMNEGSKITGNTINSTTTTSSSGGGVYNEGTFTMNGGEISGNTANTSYSSYSATSYAYGGGVYNEGTFTMNGGEIAGNTAITSYYSAYSYGGGVYNSGTFTMNGGEISGNTASASSYSHGGGVYNTTDKNFRMIDGVIYGSETAAGFQKNTAANGAAIYGSGTTGTFNGSTFVPGNSLSTGNATIRVVNGVLQP